MKLRFRTLLALSILLFAQFSGSALAQPAVTAHSPMHLELGASGPNQLGKQETLTASISPVNARFPQGAKVSFFDGERALGAANVIAAHATLAFPLTEAGAHAYRARFEGLAAQIALATPGTPGNGGANPRTGKATTSLTLTATSAPVVGSNLVLTATVHGTGLAGSVTFQDGALTLGSANLNASGVAALTLAPKASGTHTYSAAYSGNTASQASAGTLAVTVAGYPTTTSLSAASGVLVNKPMALTATIRGLAPTGKVTFKEGAVVLGTGTLSAAGVATVSTTYTSAGSHSFTAQYTGDTVNAVSQGSASGSVGLITSTVNLASTPNPMLGTPEALTAVVTGTNPSGNVTFKDGAIVIGTVALVSGTAKTTVTPTVVGAHAYSALYAGDSANGSATGTLSASVAPAASSTTLTVTPTAPVAGASMMLTAQVQGVSPTGTVTFKDGTTTLGSASLNAAGQAIYSIPAATAGTHALSASYAGDTRNAGSSAQASQAVASANSTIALAAAQSALTLGSTDVLTATVQGYNPSGAVVFLDNGVTLGSVNLASGTARFTAAPTTTGVHAYSASYGGDSSNKTATSGAVNVTVNLLAATVNLAASATTATVGAPVTFTATVKTSGTSVPTGTVSFLANAGTSMGTAPLNSQGVAVLATSFVSAGTAAVTAQYSGSSTIGAQSSSPVSLAISAPPVTMTLTASPGTVMVMNSTTLAATLSGSAQQSGSVSFYDGNSPIASVTVTSNSAQFPWQPQTAGTRAIQAVFTPAIGGTPLKASVTVSATPYVDSATLTASATSVMAGKPIALSASVNGYKIAGSATFKDNGTAIATVPLAYVNNIYTANYSATPTVVGIHTYSVSYSGDANNNGASASAPAVTVTAVPAPLVITVPATLGAVPNGILNVAIKVNSATPTGKLSLTANGAAVPMAIQPSTSNGGNGVGLLPISNAGTYALVASYTGDASAPAGSVTGSVKVTPGTSSTANLPTGNHMNYWGGPVMDGGVNVYTIWYGNWTNSVTPAILNKFFNGLNGSAFSNINATYPDSSGNAPTSSIVNGGAVYDNYSQGTSLNDGSVAAIVQSAINNGNFPHDPNGVYFVMTSADVKETTGFCTAYCGWHSSMGYDNTAIKFAFVGAPEQCGNSCGLNFNPNPPNGNASADATVNIVGHELNEATSDPNLTAWFSNDQKTQGYESGDMCAWNFPDMAWHYPSYYNLSLPTGDFNVQGNWVNANGGGCTMHYP